MNNEVSTSAAIRISPAEAARNLLRFRLKRDAALYPQPNAVEMEIPTQKRVAATSNESAREKSATKK